MHIKVYENSLLNLLLASQSGNVGVAVFMIDWYHLPTKTIQNLILIMAMSNTPAKLSVGRILDLSLSTFGNVRLY